MAGDLVAGWLRAAGAALGDEPQPPASEREIAGLRRRAAVLGGTLPGAHLAVLRRLDGYDGNGLVVFGTAPRPLAGAPGVSLEGLVEANLAMREGPGLRDHIVLAAGNLDLYTVHRPTGAFQVLDRVPGRLIFAVASYVELMAEALRAHR